MTDDVGWAELGVRPDFTGFPSALSRGVSGPMERAGREGGSRLVTGMRATVRRGVGSIVAPLAGAFAGFEVVNFFKDSVAEGREAQKANALTTSTLKNLGDQASVTARHIGVLANAQSRKAAIDDEEIQSGENALLTYTSVRNEVGKHNRIFDRATKASVNYAAALAGQNGGGAPNVVGASRLVGKALADPEKGIAKLTRAGVVFTKQQIDSVKAFEATGNIMGAQKILLQGLESRYDGAAKSQATLGEKVGVAWKNIEENFGNALLPLIDDVEGALLNKGLPTVNKWVNAFQKDGIPAVDRLGDVLRDKGIPMLKGLVDEGEPLAESILPAIGTAAHDIADGLSAAAPYAKDMVDAFNNAPDWVQKGTVFTALAALGGKKLGLFSRSGGQSAIGALVKGSPGSSPATALWVRPIPGAGGVGGTRAGGGNQIITKGDDEGKTKTRGRLKGAGNLLASAIASFFGPELVSEGQKEIVWPWEKGPFSNKPQDNGIDRFVQGLAGKTPEMSTSAILDPFVAALQEKASKHALHVLLGTDLDTTRADAKLTMFRQKAEKPIQVPLAVEVQTGLSNFFEDAFGAAKPGPLTHGRGAGVQINIEKMMAHDYGDMQRQLQQRTQQANLGGRPVSTGR